MSLANLQYDISRIEHYQGNAFINDGGTYRDLGELTSIEINWTAVRTSRDTKGRQKQNAVDFEVSIVMQQTSAQELSAMEAIVSAEQELKLTKRGATSATAGAAEGFTFTNALIGIDGAIRLNGDENSMTISFTGRCSVAELANFGAGSVTFGQ